jgi:hypothetical protein
MRQRLVIAQCLNKTTISRRSTIRHHDTVVGLLLPAHAPESNTCWHLLFYCPITVSALRTPKNATLWPDWPESGQTQTINECGSPVQRYGSAIRTRMRAETGPVQRDRPQYLPRSSFLRTRERPQVGEASRFVRYASAHRQTAPKGFFPPAARAIQVTPVVHQRR